VELARAEVAEPLTTSSGGPWTSLIGPEGYVLDRLSALAESGVTTLAVRSVVQDAAAKDHASRLRLIERVRGLIDRL
jgi:hypothetical protein